MYVVVFKAKIAEVDDEYLRVAEQLRQLAFKKYGCRDFVSMSEGDQEIAISYWDSLEHIRAWKKDPEHRRAQAKGRQKWYSSFNVDICEVVS